MIVKSIFITISIKNTMKLFYFIMGISAVLSRECWTPGQIYRGTISRTLDWKACQYWSSQENFQSKFQRNFYTLPFYRSMKFENSKKTPHKHEWVPKLRNNETVKHNFCSNEFDTSEPPWCYYSTRQVCNIWVLQGSFKGYPGLNDFILDIWI